MSFIASKKPKVCPNCHGHNFANNYPDSWVCEDCGHVITIEDSIFAQTMTPKRKRRGRNLFNILFGNDEEE